MSKNNLSKKEKIGIFKLNKLLFVGIFVLTICVLFHSIKIATRLGSTIKSNNNISLEKEMSKILSFCSISKHFVAKEQAEGVDARVGRSIESS